MVRSMEERMLLITIGIIILLELMDSNIINTSLPQIAYSLEVNPIKLKVAITIYLLTLGMCIPAASWFAEKFGSRKIIIICLTGFMLSSLSCGLATNIEMLTISRAIQGVFAAFTVPVARIIMAKVFHDRLVYATAFTASIILIGPMIGPIIGGVVTTFIGWRYIFFIHVPVILITLVAVLKFIPEIKENQKYPFDIIGFIILGSAIGLSMLLVDSLVNQHIGLIGKMIIAIACVSLFASYAFYALKKRGSIINLRIFRNITFSYFIITSVLLRVFAMGMSFIIPLYLQTQYQYSPLKAGLFLIPLVIGSWTAKRWVKRILEKFHYRKTLFISFIYTAAIQVYLGFIMSHYSEGQMLVAAYLLGLSIGFFTTTCSAAVYKSLPQKHIGPGIVINTATMQLGSGFAVAFIAAILIISSGEYMLSWNQVLPLSSFSMVMYICSSLMICLACSMLFTPKAVATLSTD
jgi:EmrB/QacA subfamily drug resistance transporter